MESVHEGRKKRGDHSGPQYSLLLSMLHCTGSKNLKIQRHEVGLAVMPKQHTPQGWPETDVFVPQDMPRSMCLWMLREFGLFLSKSRNRNEATVAHSHRRKHPSITISRRLESSDRILCSQAAKTAIGIGVASDLSNGIRVWVFKKSETVWLWTAVSTGRSNFNAIQRMGHHPCSGWLGVSFPLKVVGRMEII